MTKEQANTIKRLTEEFEQKVIANQRAATELMHARFALYEELDKQMAEKKAL